MIIAISDHKHHELALRRVGASDNLGSMDGPAHAASGDVLACGVHVADIAALILDLEERDQLASITDVAATFGIQAADVHTALRHYGANLDRLRPIAHTRRSYVPRPTNAT